MNLRELARDKICYMRLPGCNGDPSTTVLCHIRRGSIAGVGQKPSDFCAMPMCVNCHAVYDGRAETWRERVQMDADALMGLVQWLAWLDKNGKIKVV